jgi:hypothetical protein
MDGRYWNVPDWQGFRSTFVRESYRTHWMRIGGRVYVNTLISERKNESDCEKLRVVQRVTIHMCFNGSDLSGVRVCTRLCS